MDKPLLEKGINWECKDKISKLYKEDDVVASVKKLRKNVLWNQKECIKQKDDVAAMYLEYTLKTIDDIFGKVDG